MSYLGYVASHGGNVSYRLDRELIIVTPTKLAKRKLTADDVVLINANGDIIDSLNGRCPTGEMPMHLRIFERRPDIRSVLHAHPPVLTGFAISGTDLLSRAYLPEPAIEIGPVQTVPYAEPVSESLAKPFDAVVDTANAFLMENHGVVVCCPEGADRALDLLELLEQQAVSVLVVTLLGRARELPPEEITRLDKTLRTRGLSNPGQPLLFKTLSDAFNRQRRHEER